MAKKKTAIPETRNPVATVQTPSPYHRIDALLHTMRCIAQHEDALCELLHEVRGAAGISEEQARDLRGILEKLPSHDYLYDLESAGELVGELAGEPGAPSR